jgi:hypothetical protein
MNEKVRAWWVGITPKLTAYIVVVIALVCLASVWASTRALETDRLQQFELKGAVISHNVLAHLEANDDGGAQRSLRLNKEHRGVKYIFVTDKEGRSKFHTFAAAVPDELRTALDTAQRDGIDKGLQLARSVTYKDIDGDTAHVMDIKGVSTANGAVIHVGMDLDVIQTEAVRMRNYMVAAGAGVGVLGIILLLFMTRDVGGRDRRARPVLQLAHEAPARDPGGAP